MLGPAVSTGGGHGGKRTSDALSDPWRPHLRSRRRRPSARNRRPADRRREDRAHRAKHRRLRRRGHRSGRQTCRAGLRQCALSFARCAAEGHVRGDAVRHLGASHQRRKLRTALTPRTARPHADRRRRDAAQRHYHGAGFPDGLSGRRGGDRHRAVGLCGSRNPRGVRDRRTRPRRPRHRTADGEASCRKPSATAWSGRAARPRKNWTSSPGRSRALARIRGR